MDSKDKTKCLIYLDNNATTPLAEEVIAGIKDSLITDWGNPSSNNPYGAKGRAAIGKAREDVANMLGCSPTEIVFTSGGTEANNMIINSAVQYYNQHKELSIKAANERPHIITSNVEHDSVTLPLKYLESVKTITCSFVQVNTKGCVNIDEVLSKIKPQTCLITIMYANNETGVIMPIPEIGLQLSQINKKRENMKLPKVLFHTDAAQIIGKEKISFHGSNSHFMTVVGHKFYGPRIGCICAREKLFPLFFGGGQEKGIRPGTENTPMIVGLGIAAQLISLNIENQKAHLLKCREKLETKLKQVFGNEIQINCSESRRLANTCSVAFKRSGLEGPLILAQCKKVIASVGSACHGGQCSQILINSGVPMELAKNSIRLSVGRNTTVQEIEDAVLDLESAVNKISGTSSL